jgi:microcystin-dependent protein
VPIHTDAGQGYPQGAYGGAEMVTLIPQVFPEHRHELRATSSPGTSNTAAGNVLAQPQALKLYANANGEPSAVLNQATLGPSQWDGQPYGSNSPEPHENRQPFQCVNFIIAVMGLVPTTT